MSKFDPGIIHIPDSRALIHNRFVRLYEIEEGWKEVPHATLDWHERLGFSFRCAYGRYSLSLNRIKKKDWHPPMTRRTERKFRGGPRKVEK